MFDYRTLISVALVLVCVGAINWGIRGAAAMFGAKDLDKYDLVQQTAGRIHAQVANAVYIIVGLAAPLVLADVFLPIK